MVPGGIAADVDEAMMVDEKQGCRGKRDALKALAASDDVAWGAAYSSFGSTLYEIGKNWQLNNSGRSRPLLTGGGGGWG